VGHAGGQNAGKDDTDADRPAGPGRHLGQARVATARARTIRMFHRSFSVIGAHGSSVIGGLLESRAQNVKKSFI
jgi:hypothetical protein